MTAQRDFLSNKCMRLFRFGKPNNQSRGSVWLHPRVLGAWMEHKFISPKGSHMSKRWNSDKGITWIFAFFGNAFFPFNVHCLQDGWVKADKKKIFQINLEKKIGQQQEVWLVWTKQFDHNKTLLICWTVINYHTHQCLAPYPGKSIGSQACSGSSRCGRTGWSRAWCWRENWAPRGH